MTFLEGCQTEDAEECSAGSQFRVSDRFSPNSGARRVNVASVIEPQPASSNRERRRVVGFQTEVAPHIWFASKRILLTAAE